MAAIIPIVKKGCVGCEEMSNSTITKHRFRFGEEWYTICITIDDWWLEEELVDMSDDMMRAGEEFAIEHRTG